MFAEMIYTGVLIVDAISDKSFQMIASTINDLRKYYRLNLSLA